MLASSKAAKAEQLEVINFLRGIAALSVAWFHFTNGNVNFLDSGLLKFSGKYGYLGVEVFFVISGFIIPYSLWRSHFNLRFHWNAFLGKRLLRLHPAYLITIALTIFLSYASSLHPSFQGSVPNLDPINLVLHLAYLNGIFNRPWLSPVFWTLAIEFQYYFLIILIYSFLSNKKIDTKNQSNLNYFFHSILCCVPLIFMSLPNLVFHWLNLFEFGIISFQYFSNNINFKLYCVLTIINLAFSWLAIGWLFTIIGFLTSIAITFLKFPKLLIFSLLAEFSYSLYLVHVPIGGRIINIGERLSDSMVFKFLVLLTALAFSLASAYLMYVFIEKPTQKWSKSIRYN